LLGSMRIARILAACATMMSAAMALVAAARSAGLLPAAMGPAAMAVALGRPAIFLGLDLLGRQVGQVMRQHVYLHADDALDIAQIGALGRVAEADGDAFAARARRAPDAVDIGFRLVGQLEVDHMGDVIDI